MNICMFTNTYLPHIGGVARSVSTFAEDYRRLGQKVLVVAPTFDGRPPPQRHEKLVERVPAIQNFNGSDFSVRLPLAASLSDRLDRFQADIVHAHHPFLLGDTALRVAAGKNVPIVFTHHTRYEDYTHYVPFDSPALKEVATHLPTQFANLCDGVIAPSQSIADLIRERGVLVPVAVVPTGIDVAAFRRGDGKKFRARHGIPPRAFVVGHVGRLAPEKNLGYLAEAVGRFLRATREAYFVLVGGGPAEQAVRDSLARQGVADRLIFAGKHTGRGLHAAYRAMDVFAFASFSETQGMVLAEAMAAGVPVVALNAPGVREVVRSRENGVLLPARTRPARFAAALAELHAQPEFRRAAAAGARRTAGRFGRDRCAQLALDFYAEIRRATRRERLEAAVSAWSAIGRRLELEWELLASRASTIATALLGEDGAAT